MNNNTRGVRRVGRRLLVTIFALAIALPGLAMPAPAEAAIVVWTEDTTLRIQTPAVDLIIVDGSMADQLDIYPGQFTVTAAAGETFKVIWPGPNPGYFVNNGGKQECFYINGDNHLEILGPQTITISPDTSRICGPPSGGGGGGSIPTMVINNPYGSQVMNAGDDYSITWTASGFGLVTIRLSLSTDSGSTWTVITDNQPNDGHHNWSVPNVDTDEALVKGEVVSSTGSVLRADTSNSVFTINPYPEGYEPPEAEDPFIDTNVSGGYDAQSAYDSTTSINTDKGLSAPPEGTPTYCTSGTRIKIPTSSAVYYCGADGKRHVFPNEPVYFSWYENWDGVVTITPEDLAMIPLGTLVSYRPGSRMVKIQSDPSTYAVARGGTLRWVTSEAVAVALYGPTWNTFIDDVNPAFFFSYTIGDPITEADVGL